MKIGFIGFGEASSNIAAGLLSESGDHIIAFDVDMVHAETCVSSLGLKDRVHLISSLDELLVLGDVFFVAVPGRLDECLFDGILSLAPDNKVFFDLCTELPQIKKSIEAKLLNSGCLYTDVAVMGSVPALRHRVPMYVSGSGADKMIDLLSPYHFDIEKVGNLAGEASVIKLCRSVYMKGLAALSIEMTKVSEFYGVKDRVYDSIAKSLDNDSFRNYTQRLIDGTVKHKTRRIQEVQDCLEVIHSANIPGRMTEGILSLYEEL